MGDHIFRHLICDFLSDRTRILVSHQLTLTLSKADLVVVLDGSGGLAAACHPNQLTQQLKAFAANHHLLEANDSSNINNSNNSNNSDRNSHDNNNINDTKEKDVSDIQVNSPLHNTTNTTNTNTVNTTSATSTVIDSIPTSNFVNIKRSNSGRRSSLGFLELLHGLGIEEDIITGDPITSCTNTSSSNNVTVTNTTDINENITKDIVLNTNKSITTKNTTPFSTTTTSSLTATTTTNESSDIDNDNDNTDTTTIEIPSLPSRVLLVEKEAKSTGKVHLGIYWFYLKSSGGILTASLFLILNISITVAWFYNSYALGDWMESIEMNESNTVQMNTLIIYIISVGICIFVILSMNMSQAYCALKASRTIHFTLLHKVLRATLAWHDSQPTGRKVNRFSQDISTLDTNVMDTLHNFFDCCLSTFQVVLVISIFVPIMLVFMLPVIIYNYIISDRYIRLSRELKRLESINKSPIFVLFQVDIIVNLTTLILR